MKRKSRNASDAKTYLTDKLHAHKMWQSTSTAITTAINGMQEHFHLRGHEWDYLRGYGDAIRNLWYHHDLVYCVYWNDKPIVMQWDAIPEECREHIRQGKAHQTGHFWKNKDGTVGRPYFVSEVAPS